MENNKFFESAQRKKPYKFNIIDFILVVVIIAAAAVLIYIMLGNDIFSGNEKITMLYEIEISVIKNEFITLVPQMPGTKLTDSVRHYDIGEVQSVKIEDAYQNHIDLETGVIHSRIHPDHSKVTITVKADFTKSGQRYMVNGKNIMVGVRVDFRTPYLISYGFCTSMVKVGEEGE